MKKNQTKPKRFLSCIYYVPKNFIRTLFQISVSNIYQRFIFWSLKINWLPLTTFCWSSEWMWGFFAGTPFISCSKILIGWFLHMHTKSLTRGHRRVSRINEITENYRNHRNSYNVMKLPAHLVDICLLGLIVKFYCQLDLYAYDFMKEYVENTNKPEVAILFFFLDCGIMKSSRPILNK